MGAERSKVLKTLNNFKNPTYMKNNYGIIITKEQINATDRIIDKYKKINESEIKKEDPVTINQIPYNLTINQQYDMMLFAEGIHFNIVQTLLWQNVKKSLCREKNVTKNDAQAIGNAVREIEEFLQLNVYLGRFDQNEKLIDNHAPDELIRLFNNAYKKYSQ